MGLDQPGGIPPRLFINQEKGFSFLRTENIPKVMGKAILDGNFSMIDLG